MSEPDNLIKKWSTLLNSTNNTTAMLIEPMEVKIKIDRGNQIHKELKSIMNKKIKRRLSYDVWYWSKNGDFVTRVSKYFESAKKAKKYVNHIHNSNLIQEYDYVRMVKTWCYRKHSPKHKWYYESRKPNQFICYERY